MDYNMIIKGVAAVLKERDRSSKDKEVYFSKAYERSVEMYERVKVHSQSDVFPEKLFREKAPNQSPEEWKYQKNLFKAIGSITHPYWDKALGVVRRIWNEKNYTIRWPIIESPIYENYPADIYFTSEYPRYGAIETYFSQVVTAKKLEDPNAFICLHVDVTEDNKPAMPYHVIYESKKVVSFEDEVYVMVMSEEKSLVKYGNRMVAEGYVFYIWDDTNIYKVEQVGVKVEYKFAEPEIIYTHNLGYLPCWRLKGKPTNINGKLVYESYFYAAIPSLNTAIIDFSTNQLSKIINTFPQKWEYFSECDECDGGKVYNQELAKYETCGTCLGTGQRQQSSVTSVIQVKIPKRDQMLGEDTAAMSMPPAGYIDKTNANDQIRLLIEEIETSIIRAFAMLNIDVSNTNAKGADTALGKQIDREELFSFLLNLATELFDLMRYCINAQGEVRYGDAWNKVVIGTPQNFGIRSDADITAEISEAKSSGTPDVAIQALLREYADVRFNSQEDVQEVFELTFAADRLITLSQVEITQKVLTGACAKWEVVLHDSINYFLGILEEQHQPTEDYPTFWDLPKSDKVRLLQDLAKATELEMRPPTFNPISIIEG